MQACALKLQNAGMCSKVATLKVGLQLELLEGAQVRTWGLYGRAGIQWMRAAEGCRDLLFFLSM